MTNISNMFLAKCWGLETSSRLFYNFIKITIQQDLAIFNGWHIPFLIVLYSSFQKKVSSLESGSDAQKVNIFIFQMEIIDKCNPTCKKESDSGNFIFLFYSWRSYYFKLNVLEKTNQASIKKTIKGWFLHSVIFFIPVMQN